MRLKIRTVSLRTANLVLVMASFALGACRLVYEFIVVQDNNSAILARVSKLLSAEGFKSISQFSPDDVRSSDTDSFHDHYLGRLVDLLRHELDSEVAAGRVIVRTKQYVALGP